MSDSKCRVSRRRFLGRSAAALAAPLILPSRVLGLAGQTPPSQTVVAALIGCGGRGGSLLGMHSIPGCSIVAVCDVDRQRMENAQKRVSAGLAFQDFRRILDRNDIDAVVIAAPDHWHAPITVMACQAGKDVYCEKPLCRSVVEGRRMVQAARRHGRIVQMGTQYRSIARTRQACEWIRNGRLGQVHTVKLTHAPNPTHPIEPAQPVPANLDYDLWLGPAPWAPYHPKRCHFSFRFFMDYGGGFIADNGVHMFSVVSWAMGTDQTGPVSVQATGTPAGNSLYTVPVELRAEFEFADPPWRMIWEQAPGAGLNLEFIGSRATLSGFWDFRVTAGEADLSPTRGSELHLAKSLDHSINWLECIATRARPVMDVETGHRVTTWSHLGNIAWRLGRKLRWDPKAESFIGDEEANRLLHRSYRAPWRL